MRRIGLALLAPLAFAPALPVAAQVQPMSHQNVLELGILGTAQAYRWDFQPVTTGFTVFADVRRSTWIGMDFRGLITQWNYSAHTYSFEAGPRVAPTFGRITPYAELLGGAVHQLIYSGEVGGAVGVDVRVAPHVSWRTDGSYNYVINETDRRQLSTGIAVKIGGDS